MTVKTGRQFYSTGWAYIAQGERFSGISFKIYNNPFSRLGHYVHTILRKIVLFCVHCCNNCEHFAVWCKTGVRESSQVQRFLEAITDPTDPAVR